MKKYCLKKWVKVALVAISILIICGVMKLFYVFEESEVKNCMDYGYSETYCRSDR